VQAYSNVATTVRLQAEQYEQLLGGLIARLTADMTSVRCNSVDELEALRAKWTDARKKSAGLRQSVPELEEGKITVPDGIDDLMVPVREQAKKDLEKLQELGKGLGEALEMAHLESLIAKKIVEYFMGH
jgi:hypothetical protein